MLYKATNLEDFLDHYKRNKCVLYLLIYSPDFYYPCAGGDTCPCRKTGTGYFNNCIRKSLQGVWCLK